MTKEYGTPADDWAVQTVETLLKREPEVNLKGKWEYEDGLMLDGVMDVYERTHNSSYLDYIKHYFDTYINENGDVKGYDTSLFRLDDINNGKVLLRLYKLTKDEKYKKVLDRQFQQLKNQPRTSSNLFWHKKSYPNQVWLDGVYMADVFYAEYLESFQDDPIYDDVIHQFLKSYDISLDEDTSLCYHAVDESKNMYWANKTNGHSPHFWLRSIGWYVMAMTDVIEHLPKNSTGRKQILQNLNNLLTALRKIADPATNLWYQIPDEGSRPMNYLESSGSLMILNAIAKSLRMGYLTSDNWQQFLIKGWENALKQFISITNEGYVNVNKIAHVGGLGGPNHRDGSFAYYMSEPIVSNDHKGTGPFIMLANEMYHYYK
ncbi:glycoside hydrolase family 88 protein [Limosilactobacillus sp. STM2_1]|uniref:Glycoside hydrolase family 88 protein n=1 Tax=Limosilactobacillus rudii TaxID=2759755 RepID=A0A7W3YMN9_9LACO|nr:glycoside hydrolase family 88 protein [Limosilactobacillus rudii]MBB1078667.1 glycoside hydrolase family 88 protein [Limosilactobacillus rudii]MBB1096765.1 glycoside hydrolase family 88 protein [Limosilactobacillus rudii]MCD7135563.1 glycoside hydrolase family 88 protein [Limosilactobacillus rudii]